jgi:hypothetical protein
MSKEGILSIFINWKLFVICFFRYIRVRYMDVISYCNNLENERIFLVGVGIIQKCGSLQIELYMQLFT